MRVLLLMCFIVSSAWASGPSATSCEFYTQLEDQYRCGDHRYLAATAKPLCERFLTAELHTKRKRLLDWMPKARLCLQEALNTDEFASCRDLRRTAVRSHLSCYLNTGFCALSLREKSRILKIVGRKIWQRDFLKLGVTLLKRCGDSGALTSQQTPGQDSSEELSSDEAQ